MCLLHLLKPQRLDTHLTVFECRFLLFYAVLNLKKPITCSVGSQRSPYIGLDINQRSSNKPNYRHLKGTEVFSPGSMTQTCLNASEVSFFDLKPTFCGLAN